MTPRRVGEWVRVVRLTPADWESHRALRLQALADTPEAFGASFADNAAYDEATWRARLEAVTYWQARDENGTPVGMVGLWEVVTSGVDPADVVPYLIAMYVTPAARGRGVGEALVHELLAEARARGHRRVLLDVTSTNRYAAALYQRLGFRFTGDTWPHPTYQHLWEHCMICEI